MSLVGLFLEPEAPGRLPFAPGDLLELKLAGHDDVPLECEVVRITDDGGIGVRYLSFTVESRKLVQQIVAPEAFDAESEPRRSHRPTGVIDEEVLRPLVEATRTGGAPRIPAESTAPLRGSKQPSGPWSTPQRSGEPRTGSNLVKALRTATGGSPVGRGASPHQELAAANPDVAANHSRSGSNLVKALRAATGESLTTQAEERDAPSQSADTPTDEEKPQPDEEQ